MNISTNILQAIGNTSMVQLYEIVPPGCAKIVVKLEWENPTGSMKDWTARAMILRAEEDGRLKPEDTIVENTGGGTGISVALVDEITAVSTDEANAMAVRLAREEGPFAGTSSGANAVAAVRIAAKRGPDAAVGTLMVDSAIEYLNTIALKKWCFPAYLRRYPRIGEKLCECPEFISRAACLPC